MQQPSNNAKSPLYDLKNRKFGLLKVVSAAMIDHQLTGVNRWRMDYNHYRPHSSLDYMAPAAFAKLCLDQGSATLRLDQDREHSREILS